MNSQSWMVVAFVTCMVCGLWFAMEVWRKPLPGALRFACTAIFFRLALSAFHPVTYPPLIGPFSINALYTLFIIGIGLLLIDRRLFTLRFLLPVYGLIVLILLSALYNGTLKESVQSLLKWLFFLVLALAVYESIVRTDRFVTLRHLALAFSVPLVLQWLSVAAGYAKATENDGSVSYVGGYHHEAVFSVVLLTALCIGILAHQSFPGQRRRRFGLPVLAAAGLLLANYRTNILAMLFPLAGYALLLGFRRGSPLARVITIVLMLSATVALVAVDFSALWQRFADIGAVLDSVSQLIKPPAYYTEWEQDYFSSRVYFWSQYINAYLHGDPAQWLIGFGADSWESRFNKYAHNTFVSTLYELGAAGTLLLVVFFLDGIRCSFNGTRDGFGFLLGCSLLGFLTANLGTMPLWQIEGMIMFAILCAFAWERQLSTEPRAIPTLVDRVPAIVSPAGNYSAAAIVNQTTLPPPTLYPTFSRSQSGEAR